MKLTKIASLVTASVLALTMSVSSFATSPTNQTEVEPKIISQTEEWVSPYEKVVITTTDFGDGYTSTRTETSTYDNPYARTSGTVTKSAHDSLMYQKRSIGYVHVEGSFSYNGESAHVIDSSYTHAFIEDDFTMSLWRPSENDSDFLVNAFVGVHYRVTKQSTAQNVLSGTCKVTCSKNGN